MEIAGVAVVVYCFALLVGGGFSVLSYVFTSLGLWTMGKRLRIPHAYMAFIPFASSYYLGKIAEKDTREGCKPKQWGKKLLTWEILFIATFLGVYVGILVTLGTSIILTGQDDLEALAPASLIGVVILAVVGVIALFALLILYVIYYNICVAKVYRLFAPNVSTVLTVFSVLFQAVVPFAFFAIRNNRPYSPYTGMPLDTDPNCYDYDPSASQTYTNPYGNTYTN